MSKNNRKKLATQTTEQTLKAFKTTENGLSETEAAKRLNHYGKNEINRKRGESNLSTFFKNFTSLMAILLWISGFIAFFTGTLVLGIAIWAINIINGLFSYWQQYQAKKATNALMKMLPTFTQVYRNGKIKQINIKEIVPGDIFELEAGSSVPVDAKILSSSSLQVNQSALTGESVPESKKAEYSSGEGEFSETNLIYAGTTVGLGSCKAVAFGTGMNTELGNIASLSQNARTRTSTLQSELNKLTKQISIIAISVGIIFFIGATLFVHSSLTRSFIFALGMIVAFIPEGLLPTVTLSLAHGVQRMAKRHALVKDLNSVETLGETNIICSDKTGTLTQNQMTVNHIWMPSKVFAVNGTGYINNGSIILNKKKVNYKDNLDLEKFLENVSLNNDTKVQQSSKKNGNNKLLGTPTEASLDVVAEKGGINLERINKQMPRLKEFPFDSNRKMMTTVNQINKSKLRVNVKGALNSLLPHCHKIMSDGKLGSITEKDRKKINQANEKYASIGLRSLAVGYKDIPLNEGNGLNKQLDNLEVSNCEEDLTFLGLAIMADPPRSDAIEAVKKCHQASIKVIMVTGDSSLTAKYIALKMGLVGKSARVITGNELDRIKDSTLKKYLSQDIIFARVAPEQKYRIVTNCQAMGNVVAATGDGVNDAPALKKADIGIAMGQTGTDVSKDSANMILTNDNFASIVSAIEEGRTVYSNIQKFLLYILNSNLPEAVPSALFLFSKGVIPLALTIMQILFVDLGTDMLPALGLGSEVPEPGTMSQPPRKRSSHLLSKHVFKMAFLWYGLIASCISVFFYFLVNYQNNWPQVPLANSGSIYIKATTMTLAAIIFCQIAAVLNCRTKIVSVFKVGFFKNHQIWFGIIFEIFLLALISYLPYIQTLFHMEPISINEWAYLFLIPIPIFLIEELRKFFVRRQKKISNFYN